MFMKKMLGFLFLFSFLLTSCGKKDTSGCQPVPVSSERAGLIAYCNANGIVYTEHTTGLLYQIISPGSGQSVISSSQVSVVYSGKLFNGTTFDFSNNPTPFWSLTGLIDGWKIGIPLIKKGGQIKLIIPSALAYSCTGNLPVIQPNAPLYFDITLSDVK